MPIKQRLIEYIKFKGISIRAFCRTIGVSESYVTSMRSSIQPDKVKSITMHFPELNTGWLLTGEGEMLRSESTFNIEEKKEIPGLMHVPLVPQYANGGYLNGYADPVYIESLSTIPVIVDKTYHGKYRCFEIKGDSMDDGTPYGFMDRDIVLGREVEKDYWREKLHINDWDFIIVHKQLGITIKRIIEHRVEEGIIVCHPLNNYYNDFEVNLNEVAELYNVIKIVERSTRR